MAKSSSFLTFSVVAVIVGVVCAITDDEKAATRAALIPILEKCGKEFSITKDDIIAAKQAKNPDALNPCFYACVFKDIGTINDQGLYDPAAAKGLHKKYVHGEEDLAKLDSITDICTSVNEQAVGDGAQACDRSKLLVHCLIKNKSIFSPLHE